MYQQGGPSHSTLQNLFSRMPWFPNRALICVACDSFISAEEIEVIGFTSFTQLVGQVFCVTQEQYYVAFHFNMNHVFVPL